MRSIVSTIIMVCVMALCSTSHADEIIFKNGERLIGTFERIQEGKLIFKSQIAGEVSVDPSQVKDINSERLFEIFLEDGTVLQGKIVKKEEDVFTVEEETEGQEQRVATANLTEIYPFPKPKVTWSGNITAGFTSSHGSSFTENTNMDWGFRLRTKRQRFRLNGWLVIERNEDSDGEKYTSEENFTVQGIYDYFFTEKIYGYWSERFKKDHIDDLDYRITSAWGVGYQWSETDKLDYSTFAGLGWLREKYTSRIPNPSYTESEPTYEKKWLNDISRRNDAILQSGYHFQWKLNNKIHYISNLAYNPSIDDWGDYNLTHDSEVRAFITKMIFASFKFIIDYDSDPGEDSSTTDTDYILGLGINF